MNGMNRKTRNSKLRSTLRIGLMAVSVLLIAWSFWPPARDRHTLRVNPQLIESAAQADCAPLNQLLDYEFEVVTPRALWKTQSSTVLMTATRVSDTGGAGAVLPLSDGSCALALETRLVIPNLRTVPGDVIIQPFVGDDTQSFVFTISPLASGTVSGKLWVYADVRDTANGEGQSLPLFAIPLDLPVWTILGASPVLARYVSLLILLILLAFDLRRRLLAQG